MRWRIVLGLLALLFAAGMAAQSWLTSDQDGDPADRTPPEAPAPAVQPDDEDRSEEPTDRHPPDEQPPDPQGVLARWLGLEAGRRWEYGGEGNEFAAFSAWVAHTTGNLFQVQEDTGGTVLARVLELRPDGAYEIYTREEHYSAENLLQSEAVQERAGVPGTGTKILPWPLTEGSTWTLPTGETATLVSVREQRTVPFGSFDEVVHVNIGSVDRYYAPGVGVIERRFTYGEDTVTSRLRWTEVGR